jgi:polar amino acid transport system substrate-binding protein
VPQAIGQQIKKEDKMHKISQLILCLMILSFVAPAFAYTTEQASYGKELYAQNCAVCHGSNGQGGPVPEQFANFRGKEAPPLVGEGFLPGMKTVDQVYDFASKNMPADNPGSLTREDYLDIISFDLQANGIKPDGKLLTVHSAKKMTRLPGR